MARWEPREATGEGQPRHGSTVEWPDEGCGAGDLARVFSEARRLTLPEDRTEMLTDEAVSRLLRLAYDASLAPEEGVYPRFRMHVAEWRDLEEIATAGYGIEFSAPLPIRSSDLLRKLAPAAEFHSSAIAIAEAAGELYCLGIVELGFFDRGDDVAMGLPQLGLGLTEGREPGLSIRVDAPGELRVTETLTTFRLRGGRIAALDTFASNPLITDWLSRAAAEFAGPLLREPGGGDPELAHHIRVILEDFLSRALSFAIAARRGGAFAVLPKGLYESPGFDGVAVERYQTTGLDLRRSVSDFMRSAREFQKAKHDATAALTMAKQWIESRRRLLAAAEALASLANVDGCVVMDHLFGVKGFGAKIRAARADLPLLAVHPRGRDARTPVDLTGFGTRHTSAYRLCAENPGTFAFVISQDGDLRVFAGAEDHVAVWEASSWMSNRERW